MSEGSDRAVLVTGGAGYVGSHTAKALHARGLVPVVFDNLSSGYREAVRWGPFEHGDIRDTAAVIAAIEKHSISAVIHFAGLIEVGRSVARPDLFWDVNVIGTLRLLEAVRLTRTPRVVFSSSAAVYGHTDLARISEAAPKHPASPYGDTKLAGERMIEAQCAAYGLTGFALRYFNAAGADTGALIGEAHEPETHLIPLAIAAALDQSRALTVFGDDFATPDGTCLRDYVHVNDLAAAHVAAVLAKRPAGSFEALNLGTGVGHSVREVIAAVQAASGRDIAVSRGPRRTGDPPILVADPSLAQQNLGWKAEHSSLDEIVGDAMRWEAAPAYGVGHRASRATGLAAVAA